MNFENSVNYVVSLRQIPKLLGYNQQKFKSYEASFQYCKKLLESSSNFPSDDNLPQFYFSNKNLVIKWISVFLTWLELLLKIIW